MNDVIYEFPADNVPDEGAAITPHRRRLRMAALAALVGLVGAGIGWGIWKLERGRAKGVTEDDFRLEVDLQNRPFVAVAEVPTLSRASLESLAYYPHLQSVDLSAVNAVDGGLEPLLEIADLRVLTLANCEWVDDEQAAWLAQMKALKRIDLSGTQVTDAILPAIQTLPELSQLSIERCRGITDAGLATLADMPQLQAVWVSDTGCTAEGILTLYERRTDLMLEIHSTKSQERSGDQPSDVHLVRASYPIRHMDAGFRALRTEKLVDEEFDETWSLVHLQGGNAGPFLRRMLPGTPNLEWLTLEGAQLRGAEFPFDLLPASLTSVSLKYAALDEAFVQKLMHRPSGELLQFENATIGGLALADMSFGHAKEWDFNLGEVDPPGADAHAWTTLSVTGPHTARSLATFLPLTPKLIDIKLHRFNADAGEIPFNLFPSQLRRLEIYEATIDDASLKVLAQQTGIEQLELNKVDIAEVDFADPALSSISNCKSMLLIQVTCNGIDLIDAAAEPLRQRLKAQLPNTQIDVHSPPLNPADASSERHLRL